MGLPETVENQIKHKKHDNNMDIQHPE